VPLLQQFDNYYARVTLKNGVNTNVRTASRAIGSVMVSVALVKRSSAELFLSSEIHAFIAQHLKVRRGLYGRAHALDPRISGLICLRFFAAPLRCASARFFGLLPPRLHLGERGFRVPTA
jgi:hypothetical protein